MLTDTLLNEINKSMPEHISKFQASFDQDKFGQFLIKTLLPCLKLKVIEAHIPVTILYTWNYYFFKLYRINPEVAAHCLKDMINNFQYLIDNKAIIKNQTIESTNEVILTPGFCIVWLKSNLLIILATLLKNNEMAKEVGIYLEENYFETSDDLKVYTFK
ncbi:MAG: hypothetical protein RSB70_02060 [Clostridium sp.]